MCRWTSKIASLYAAAALERPALSLLTPLAATRVAAVQFIKSSMTYLVALFIRGWDVGMVFSALTELNMIGGTDDSPTWTYISLSNVMGSLQDYPAYEPFTLLTHDSLSAAPLSQHVAALHTRWLQQLQ